MALVVAVVFAACGGDDEGSLAGIDGVVVEAADGREHEQGDLDYESSPPSGGDHNPIWQNCGFYDEPVFEETAVHALEHGVVWLAYSPDLSDAEVEKVRELFELSDGRAIASPHPDVELLQAIAWKHRLVVDDLDDERLTEFIELARPGDHAPEPGASCQNGYDEPSSTGAP